MRQKTRHQEKGAVLLTTLLVVSLMASLAVTMLDLTRLSVQRTRALHAASQVDWYVKGAEDFALQYLNQMIGNMPASALNDTLRSADPIVLPTDGAVITLHVRDGGQCFSLGQLKNATGQSQFRGLLVALNWTEGEAENLASRAADWMDPDTQSMPLGGEDHLYLGRQDFAHRTANTDFAGPMELRALSSLSEDGYQSIRPFICARPSGMRSSINVNSLNVWQAPLLASVLGHNNSIGMAMQLIEDRPANGYSDMEMFLAAPALQDENLDQFDIDSLSFEPQHIWVEITVFQQEVQRFAVLDLAVTDGRARIISRRRSQEHRRPDLMELSNGT